MFASIRLLFLGKNVATFAQTPQLTTRTPRIANRAPLRADGCACHQGGNRVDPAIALRGTCRDSLRASVGAILFKTAATVAVENRRWCKYTRHYKLPKFLAFFVQHAAKSPGVSAIFRGREPMPLSMFWWPMQRQLRSTKSQKVNGANAEYRNRAMRKKHQLQFLKGLSNPISLSCFCHRRFAGVTVAAGAAGAWKAYRLFGLGQNWWNLFPSFFSPNQNDHR